MALRTGDDYRAALRDDREVYLEGERVEDVPAHPAFAPVIDTFARILDLQHTPEYADVLTFTDENGNRTSGAWAEPRSKQDLVWRRGVTQAIARQSGGLFGRQPDYVSLFMLGMQDIRKDFSQGRADFEQNIDRYFRFAVENDLIMSHAFVAEQADPLKPLEETDVPRVVDQDDEGIVVRGVFTVGTFAPYSDECLFGAFPRPGMTDEHVAYYALPMDTPGIRIAARSVYGLGGSFANPAGRYGDENDSMIVLDDVRVPWDRVFSLGNPSFCTQVFPRITEWGHWSILARLAVKVEILVGLMKLMPEMIGRSANPYVQEVQGELVRYLTTIRSFLYAAEDRAAPSVSGYWMPDPMIVTAGRAYSVEHYRRITGYLQDIGSQGLVNVPSEGNLDNPQIGPVLQHVFSNSEGSARDRALAFRYAFDIACSSFGGRQTLFELFNALPWPAQRAQMLRRFDFEPLVELAKGATGILPQSAADAAALAAAGAERGHATDYDEVGAIYRNKAGDRPATASTPA